MVSTRAQASSTPDAASTGGPDEIAQKSPGVVSYMNNGHKESLAYLVTHRADLLKLIPNSDVEMISIDANKVTLEYRPSKHEGKKRLDVFFYPRLRNYEEVRPRFVELCRTSERVVKDRKPLIVYRAPKFSLIVVSIIIAFYAVLRNETLTTHPLFPTSLTSEFHQIRNLLGGREGMDKLMASTARIHVAESIAMFFYSYYRGASLAVALKWAATQLPLGFPTLFKFWNVNSEKQIALRAVYGEGKEMRRDHH